MRIERGDILAISIIDVVGNQIPTVGAFIRQIREVWGEPTNFRAVGSMATCNGAFGVTFADRTTRIFALGVGLPGQSLRIGLGYNTDEQLQRSRYHGANPWFLDDAARIYRDIYLPINLRPNRVFLYGHSAGGAVMEVFAKRYVFEEDLSGIVTYGSPKPGFSGVCREKPGLRRVRYMAVNDPVPLIPWGRFGGGLRIALGALESNQAPWNNVHGSGGEGLYPDLHDARQDAFGAGDMREQLQRWLDQEERAVRAHSAGRYFLLLNRNFFEPTVIFDPGTRDRIPVPEGVVREDVGLVMPFNPVTESPAQAADAPRFVQPMNLPIPAPAVRQVAVAINGGMIDIGHGANLPAFERGGRLMANSRVAPALRWSFSKGTDGFNVFWSDYLMASCQTRSRARSICRIGNSLLRAMGNRTTWEGAQFISAFQLFFTLAASRKDLYNPLLNVTL